MNERINDSVFIPSGRSLVGRLLIFGLIVALSLGLVLVSPASGAELAQSSGQITGTVTNKGSAAAGVVVELRQRTNSGEDKALATATTDATGAYTFTGQASAPNDAFYYIRLGGGKGTLAIWYSFPIIYLSGSDFAVPSVEISDVELVEPGDGVTLPLPGALRWKARRSGETYRVFIYAEGKTDKPALDSGSLGTDTEFVIADGALAPGKYEAVVQVRDAVVGYGQSQSRFRFTVGTASAQGSQPAPAAVQPQTDPAQKSEQLVPEATNPEAQPSEESEAGAPPAAPEKQPETPAESAAQPESSAGGAEIEVNLSADKATVQHGDQIIYRIEVVNTGTAAAEGVVVTDQLPKGAVAGSPQTTNTVGGVLVENGKVTAEVGNLAPNAKAVIEIPVSVGPDAGSNLSNQASATYKGAVEPVQSNAYIAQVAEPLTGSSPAQPQQPVQAPAAEPQAAAPQQPSGQPAGGTASSPVEGGGSAPPASQPQAPASKPAAGQPQAPVTKPAASQPQAPAKERPAAIPQTGGSFPVYFAVTLLLFILVARYLRGRSYRRV